MGRDKGSNRTKGNVKPANSGRSAELLQSFGKEGLIPTTLLGGSSLVPALGMTSTVASLQPDESQLDTNLTILLRKLGKKDSTTKVKALGELNDLCTSDPDVCTQILKYWPNYYVKLARDEDRKVRELSHVVLQIIANNVGRNLATQIKNLYPVWFLSRSDTYSVVASKAQTAFVNIFPTIEKQVQVTRFCCKEIFAFIRSERMFAGNELSKVTAIEGIIKLIQMGIGEDMPSGSGEAEGGQPQEFEFDLDLDSDAFWNLGMDESALVRRSFYTLLTLMAEKKLEQLHPKKQRLNQIMKSSLTDEKLELDALWNCFLTLITKGFYPDKQFAQKQILICCKNAFYGNAHILGPVLLPLVSKVGPFAGEELFIMLGRGYDLEKGTNEGAAIMRTYAEILAYEFQTKNQVPAHAFPFIFQNLSAASEFGRVIGNFWKTSASATTFYDELIAFTFNYENVDKIQSSSALGHFVLSFLEPLKRKTTFREVGQYQPQLHQRKQSKASGNENYDYEALDDVKKSFVKQMSQKLIEWKAWKPLSVISRNLASTGLYQDIQIDPQNIQFTEDSKIEGLKILLDLMKFQENCKCSDAAIFEKFFSGKDVALFLREIDNSDDYDSLPTVILYLESDSFLSNQNPSVTKYILKKGSTRFSPDVINSRISKLCETASLEDLDLPLIQEIMNLRLRSGSGQLADLSPLYSKIWQMFLDLLSQQTSIVPEDTEESTELLPHPQQVQNPQAEKIENIAINILSNARLPKSELFDKICNTVTKSVNSVGLNNLVDVALKTVENYDVKDRSSEFVIEPDLLVFTGFSGNPKLQDTLAPPFDNGKLQELLKRIYFESRLVMQFPEAVQTEGQMIQLGLNLLWAHSAYELWRETEKFNWDWKSIDYCEGLATELTRVLESLQASQNLTAFWNAVQSKETGHLWKSKYPEKYLMETCLKMELPIPKKPDVIPTDFSFENGVDQVLIYLNHPEANVDGVNAALIKERNAFPDKFKFETLFSHVNPEGQRQLLAYLAVTLELLKREPNFATTAACWVAAWLRFGKTIGTTKLNYLWVQKLNEAVILIDSISKTNRESDFVQEYIEFHAKNIYPVIYSHFIQLTTENLEDESIWKEFCSTKVCSAIALVPKPILISIEPDSSVLFQVFTPILLKKSPPFKLAAYHVLRRTRVWEKVIIPVELSGLLSRKVQDETKLDKVLTLLLGWDTLLKAQSETFELANFVKKDELLPKLLNLLFFKLIPDSNLKPYFDTKPNLDPNTLPIIPHLSCYLLQEVLRNLPYTVRWWWSLSLKQREKVHVEKLISKYLSAKLASEELGKVQWNESHDEDDSENRSSSIGNPGENNVTVNLHPGCNELIAKYKIEETNVILKITLPLNHPLGQVIVHISDKKLHTKITQLLNTRSHSLASGLRLWKENLDNIYKDVDECAICFFILHHVTKALPKLGCSQCRKKFHAACLYKWFQTSNKSECPLCRNLF